MTKWRQTLAVGIDSGVDFERGLALLARPHRVARGGGVQLVLSARRMPVTQRGPDPAVPVAAVVLRLERVERDPHDALHERRQVRLIVSVLKRALL